MSDLHVKEAGVEDAAVICNVIRTAFAARPRVDPPTAALDESVGSVAAAIERDGGLVCTVDGIPAGALLFADEGNGALALRRVAAVPHFQARGVASAVVGVAEEVAANRGYDDVVLRARSELPATVTFWMRRGYVEVGRDGTSLTLAKALPIELVTRSAHDTQAVGESIAALAQRGDVVLLTGELGAGKTTLTQGIATGLRVRGNATSPTFVISRVHPSLVGGPALVHVDAYRLGGTLELDDLDLDGALDDSVTVVEWGEGIAEGLSANLLRVQIARLRGGDDVSTTPWGMPATAATHAADAQAAADLRTITVTPSGARWVGSGVRSHLTAPVRQTTA
ncbi:MAG: tRNA (adenosine(37)-N6)-threonylcarbamoyltransferase complex ATPase subunit type 1 TsaE [Nocardioidaceae bacterium]|nr:tRNA (adenosine(37)-N6)-threonylcarbamoyltransferase complex ATPase subunit type 1 TsaE [Nocardioidaceae bacterium]